MNTNSVKLSINYDRAFRNPEYILYDSWNQKKKIKP